MDSIYYYIGGGVGVFLILLITIICCCCSSKPDEDSPIEPPKKTEAFQDNLEEISENVAFHVIANSNKQAARNAILGDNENRRNIP